MFMQEMLNVTRERDPSPPYGSRNGSMKSTVADILTGDPYSVREKGIISNALSRSNPYECEAHSVKKLPRGFYPSRERRRYIKLHSSLRILHYLRSL